MMIIFILFSIANSLLSTIPKEYNDIVEKAKAKAKERSKLRILENEYNENDIFYPGEYTINNFNFVLNTAVTGDSTKSLLGYAIDSKKQVAAIIPLREPNKTNINVAKDTVISVPSHFGPIKLDEMIADDGDVCIVKYDDIDPYSIFSELHINSIDFKYNTSFSKHFEIPPIDKLHSYLKSYYGNDIYKEFQLNGITEKFADNGRLYKGFFGVNWPPVSAEKDISQQEALEKTIDVKDINDETKQIKTNVGGVFGLMVGYGSDIVDDRNTKFRLAVGFETEAQFKFTIPEGEFNNINIDIANFVCNLFNFTLKIFEIEFIANVTAVINLGIKDLAFKANKSFTYDFKGGYKAQKEFYIEKFFKSTKSVPKTTFKHIGTNMISPDKDFESSKFSFDTSIYVGLETDLYIKKNDEKNGFGINGGIEYRVNVEMKHNPNVCPCPYLLGTDLHKIYFHLETTAPFILFNLPVIPAKKFFGDTPIKTFKRSNPWCFGGKYFTYDKYLNEGRKNAAALLIKSARYVTENKDRSHSEFKITLKYRSQTLGEVAQSLDLIPFQIPKNKIADNSKFDLNYFKFLRDFTSNSLLEFECRDLIKKRLLYDQEPVHEIGNGLKDDVFLKSNKGTIIALEIQAEPTINCSFNIETTINIFAKFASVEPDLYPGEEIGMIYHKQGSLYEVADTVINDEYSVQGKKDCIYTIKNVWSIEIENLTINPDVKFESVSLSFVKISGKTKKTVFSINTNDNLDPLKNAQFNLEITRPDEVIKMNINIKTLFPSLLNIEDNNILIDYNFFNNKESLIQINSPKKKWSLYLRCKPFNYPVIFDIDQIHSDSSIIFAQAFKLQTPFKQKIEDESPSSNSLECILREDEKYGIFKLEFEIDPEFLHDYQSSINALIIMKNLKPLCDTNDVGEDSFIIKMPVQLIHTYISNEKTIAYYPIPFRSEIDPDEIENISSSITLVDIYINPSEKEEYCGKIQKFPSTNTYIHTACILIANEDNQQYKYTSFTSEDNVTIKQYHYPPYSNLDIEWKLFGISMESEDKSKTALVLLWQPEVQFPLDSYLDNIKEDVTQYFSNEKEKYTLICPRCKNIEYIIRLDEEETGNGKEEKNDKFSFEIRKDKETYFYATCKNDEQIYCKNTLQGLNENKLTLISVPLCSDVNDEENTPNNEFNRNYVIYNYYSNQFTYGRDSISYYTDSKSKLSVLHVFDNKLKIIIEAKKVGTLLRISSSADGILIPFFRGFIVKKNENLKYLSIKPNDDEDINQNTLIGGSLFIPTNATLGDITSIKDLSATTSLFGIDSNLVESITVNYNDIGEEEEYRENDFCFIQSNESKCIDSNSLPLRYPEFNEFSSLIWNKTFLSDPEDNLYDVINISVKEDLYNFYPSLESLKSGEIIIQCENPTKIVGEIKVPEGVSINFTGPFDLTNLLITIYTNWAKENSGVLSFTDDVKIGKQIDVDISDRILDYNSNYDKELILIRSGSPILNLLRKNDYISPFEKYVYSISNNKIRCQYRSSLHQQKNEFCIYQNDRELCSSFNDMDSLKYDELDNFQKYFHGSYSQPITFHLVENITFTEQTFKSFFENHPSISIIITSDSKNITLDGVLVCPKSTKISFIEELTINYLIIKRTLSILNMYQEKKNDDIKTYIDLNDKKVKQINITIVDYPEYNIMGNQDNYLFIQNCRGFDGKIYIEGSPHKNDYVQYDVDSKIENKNAYITVKSTILYSEPNTFCIYEKTICNVKTGMPIKNDEVEKISNYIDTANGDILKITISENSNVEIDASPFELQGINSMIITGDEKSSIKLSGKIKTPELFKTEIINCNIEELTLDVITDISKAISSYYNVSQSKGKPKIKIIPNNLPITLKEWDDKKGKDIQILSIKDASGLDFDNQKLLMEGGFINPTTSIKAENANEKIVTLKYSFEEIKVNANTQHHFCLYESDKSKCTKDVKQINSTEFCSSATFSSLSSDKAIIQIVNDITLPSECNIDYFESKDKKFMFNLYGTNKIKGTINISKNTEIAFLNSNLVDELNIIINIKMPQDSSSTNIGVGKVLLYEGSKPKKLTVEVSSYPKEIESNEFESQQFVQGVCLENDNKIPTPSTRDFRVKVKCANTNGIYGIKLKVFTQKYDANQFCYYESDITKCTSNEKLEKYTPMKYSDGEPYFSKDGKEPTIYLYDSPKDPFTILFQMASILGYEEATIINNNNAVTIIHIPLEFTVKTKGNFTNSEIYLQYNPKTKKYGSFLCSSENIKVHPVILCHGSFTHKGSITLSNEEKPLVSLFNQDNIEQSKIMHNSEGITIKSYKKNFDYQFGINDGSSTKIDDFYGLIKSTTATYLLSDSTDINPFKLFPLRFGIKGTKDHSLTFDMVKTKASKPEKQYLYIDNLNISFKNPDAIDFGDIYVTFHNCQLNNNSIDKVKGNHLFFDRQSYDSFFSIKDKLYAFNSDEIDATKSYIYLQEDKFEMSDTPLIYLDTYNSFIDRYGRSIDFTGKESTLIIKKTLPKTKLNFKKFDNLKIITESLHDISSISNVKKMSIKFGDNNQKSVISSIQVGDDYSTEINSNGQITVTKIILNNTFNGDSKIKLDAIEVPENKKVSVEKVAFSGSIIIKDEATLSVNTCTSDTALSIIMESNKFSDVPLSLSNSNLSVNYLNVMFLDSELKDKFFVIKGLSDENCNSVKDKTHVLDSTSKDLSKSYNIKCEDDESAKKLSIKKKGLSTGQKIGIGIGVPGAVILIVVGIILYIKFKK